MAHDGSIRTAAIDWAVRIGDPGFEDWDAFTQWLERDPAHAAAYDAVSAAIADAADAAPPLQTPAEAAPARPERRWWIGGALAASLAIVGVGAWQMQGGAQAIETAPGETRVVALAGGGSVALAGGTRLLIDADDPQEATLERGQALFTIRHGAARQFAVTAGANRIVDIGTVFDVRRSGANTAVAVAEGAVVFNPERQNIHVAPGERIVVADGDSAYRRSAVPLEQVGEWRSGRLSFRDAPLGEIAEDLARATGIAFVAAPQSVTMRLSGSIRVDAVRADPAVAGPLLDVAVRRSGDRWILEPRR